MELKDKIINMFEARVMRLVTITDLTKMPQWSDTDVLGAHCLLTTYRNVTPEQEDTEDKSDSDLRQHWRKVQIMIEELNHLPIQLIEQAYGLDVIRRRIQLKWNKVLASQLSDNYISESKYGIFFKVDDYQILMDRRDDL